MTFYRYEVRHYANTVEGMVLTFPIGIEVSIELREFDLVKETPKGYWIEFDDSFGYSDLDWKKWIPRISRKRFAYPTKKEAMVNFVKRTEKRIKILQKQIWLCKEGLEIINKSKTLKL